MYVYYKYLVKDLDNDIYYFDPDYKKITSSNCSDNMEDAFTYAWNLKNQADKYCDKLKRKCKNVIVVKIKSETNYSEEV